MFPPAWLVSSKEVSFMVNLRQPRDVAQILLSVLFLAEKVSAVSWAAVLTGFLGVIIMVRPGSDLFDWAALLPILQTYMGHSSVADTDYYLRLTAESYPHVAAHIQHAYGDIVPPITAGETCDGN